MLVDDVMGKLQLIQEDALAEFALVRTFEGWAQHMRREVLLMRTQSPLVHEAFMTHAALVWFLAGRGSRRGFRIV